MVRHLLECRKNLEKIAIICNEAKITYKEWHVLSKKLSKVILENADSGIIGLYIPNSIEYAVGYFACLYANKVIAPIYINTAEVELINTIRFCEISILIITEAQVSNLLPLIYKYGIQIKIIVIDKNSEFKCIYSFFQKGNSQKELLNVDLSDVILLLQTSGSTDTPKRVMLTNKGLLKNIEGHCKSVGFTENEVCLIQLPMVFGYCNTAQFLAHVFLGATIVINSTPYTGCDFYRLVNKHSITNFTTVPTILTLLSESNITETDISSLRIICFGGSPISKDLLSRMIKKFPSIAFIQTYGLTEAGPRVTTVPNNKYIEKNNSVGIALPDVKLKVVDQDGFELKCNTEGEIIVKSDSIMKGYFKLPKETSETIRDGWLYTGDIGYLTDDGYLYLKGRKKNLIITGGYNVFPEEVEKVLLLCPHVLDAFVYSKHDSILGEIVCADIVKSHADIELEHEIKEICIKNLSNYKIPKCFRYVNQINRTYNGKLKR